MSFSERILAWVIERLSREIPAFGADHSFASAAIPHAMCANLDFIEEGTPMIPD
jgi:hypothetical protein